MKVEIVNTNIYNQLETNHVSVIQICNIRKILTHTPQNSKCYHHGRGRFSVHRDQFLTDSDTRGLDPRPRHRINPFSRVTSHK